MWLFKAKIKPSLQCNYCAENDTIEHFLLHCTETKLFWTRFITWWNGVAEGNYYVFTNPEDKELLFGLKLPPKHYVVNQILVLAKKYIHDSKLTGNAVSFFSFLVLLKQHILYEKEISYRENQIELFDEHWQWMYEQL